MLDSLPDGRKGRGWGETVCVRRVVGRFQLQGFHWIVYNHGALGSMHVRGSRRGSRVIRRHMLV